VSSEFDGQPACRRRTGTHEIVAPVFSKKLRLEAGISLSAGDLELTETDVNEELSGSEMKPLAPVERSCILMRCILMQL
jgi:hypothetical protein